MLARAGMSPYVFDFDTIEAVNMCGQLYGKKHIGKAKVDALAEVVKDFTNEDITAFNEKVTNETMSTEFVFSGFDNMQARKDMFESWFMSNKENPNAIFIDGRLLMEQAQIFCIKTTLLI
jgi:tRNA A37 threonylcarbamoyladenosine dehydratase